MNVIVNVQFDESDGHTHFSSHFVKQYKQMAIIPESVDRCYMVTCRVSGGKLIGNSWRQTKLVTKYQYKLKHKQVELARTEPALTPYGGIIFPISPIR